LPPLFGRIDTLAGDSARRFSGDGGDCARAGLNRPSRCAVDAAGNLLLADVGNRRIRLIDLINRTTSTYAGNGESGHGGDGGPATAASFGEPLGIAIAKNGDLYISDRKHHMIRKVDVAGKASTIAGSATPGYSGDGGPASQARLNGPTDIAVDAQDGVLVADAGSGRIRRIDGKTAVISTLAGGGENTDSDPVDGLRAALLAPVSVASDAEGNVYICERDGNRVRRLSPDGRLAPFAGTGVAGYSGDSRSAIAATLRAPEHVYVDPSGNVLIADTGNHAIRFVERLTGLIYTVAGGRRGFRGDGRDASAAALDTPTGCTTDADGYIYIADSANNRIRTVVSAATEGDGSTYDEPLRDDESRQGRRGVRGGERPDEE